MYDFSERQSSTKTNENQQQEKIMQKARPHVSVFDEAKRQPKIPNIKVSHSNQSNLQRKESKQTFSNQAAQPLIQAKLKIGQPNDKYEQEADRIAGRILQTSNPSRMDSINTTLRSNSSYISNRSGHSLPRNVRNYFEPKLGYDLSSVRVHTDSAANASAQSLHSLAYTVGQDIVFNNNQFSPQTVHGRKILAHELVHVIQQTRNTNTRPLNATPETTPQLKQDIQIQKFNPFWWLLSLPGCRREESQPEVTAIHNGPEENPIGLGESGSPSTANYIGAYVLRHVIPPVSSLEVREQLGGNIRETGSFLQRPGTMTHAPESEWTCGNQEYPDYILWPIDAFVWTADRYGLEGNAQGTYSFNQLNIYRSVGSSGDGTVVPYSGFRIDIRLEGRQQGPLQVIISKEPEACSISTFSTEAGRGSLNPQTVNIERSSESARCSTEDECKTRHEEPASTREPLIQRYVSPESSVEELAPLRHERRFHGIAPPLRRYDDATLYGPDYQPLPEHVEQFQVSDCWLMATLMALSSTDAGRRHIVSHIRPNHEISEHQSTTYTVTLYDLFDGTQQHYRMEPVFPESSASVRPGAVYEGSGLEGGILWVAMYERAMAHHRHSYINLETPGIRANAAFRSITGHWGTERWEINSGNVDQVYDEIIASFRSDQAIVISTRQSLSEDAPFSSRHAYSVIELREDSGTTSIRVANPHGQRAGASPPELPVSREDLSNYFNYVAIGERLSVPEEIGSSGCGDRCVAPRPSAGGRIIFLLMPQLTW